MGGCTSFGVSILVSIKDKVCRHESRQNHHSMLIQRKHGGVIRAMDLIPDQTVSLKRISVLQVNIYTGKKCNVDRNIKKNSPLISESVSCLPRHTRASYTRMRNTNASHLEAIFVVIGQKILSHI